MGLSSAAAATELRLGLPGTVEEEEAEGGEVAAEAPLTLELLPKGSAKRGFTDAIVEGAAGQRQGAAARGKAAAEDLEEEEEERKAQATAAKYVDSGMLIGVWVLRRLVFGGLRSFVFSLSFGKKVFFFFFFSKPRLHFCHFIISFLLVYKFTCRLHPCFHFQVLIVILLIKLNLVVDSHHAFFFFVKY